MNDEQRIDEALRRLAELRQDMAHRISDTVLRQEIARLLAQGGDREFSDTWPHLGILPSRVKSEHWQN